MTSYGPPPGPGVQPPFAAPPTDGDRTRVWIGLGIGAAALVLCCVTGIAGLGGLVYTTQRAYDEQAQAAVRQYLDGLSREDYGRAYEVLCDSAQQRESEREFAQRVGRTPRVVSFSLGDTEIGDEIVVPADVSFTTGRQQELRFLLTEDPQDGHLEVCGIE